MVKTGKGPISFMVVLAIWALSLGVDLPGLAVTPMLDSLNKIFGHDVSQLEVQLLTVLPNLVIIPFVLLSGVLSRTHHKILIVVISLVIYLASGILYLFSTTMIELIVISCLLGVGCGLLLPFSTGLVADVFVGKYRMKQMGIISAIGNIALMVATLIVGALVAKNWHYPFLVYLIPIVPLLLAPWLKKIPKDDLADLPAQAHQDDATENAQHAAATAAVAAGATPEQAADDAKKAVAAPAAAPATDDTKKAAPAQPAAAPTGAALWPPYPGEKVTGGFYIGRTIWLMCAYFFFVYASSCPSIYMSYLMANDSTTAVGIVTCVFYLAMFIVGIILTPILKAFRKGSFILTILCFIIGSLGMILFKSAWMIGIGYAIMGIGNGIAQPIFYDKATEVVTSNSRSTLSLAILLAANYLAISAAPEIVDFFRWIFGVSDSNNYFPFWLNLAGCVIVLILMCVRIDHFVFGIKKEYYE